MTITVFFDLDDVTANFCDYINKKLQSYYMVGDILLKDDWNTLRREHGRIFRDLYVIDSTAEIISELYSNDVELAFLSAIPFDGIHPWQYAPSDKIKWVENNFGEIPCFLGPYSHNKHYHCKKGDILIDDKLSNCEEWTAAGGIAHLYRDELGCRNFFKDTGIL